jgi:hexosaminidase
MKKINYTALLLLISVTTVWSQQSLIGKINIIPEPVSLKVEKGSFRISKKTSIFISPNLNKQTGFFLAGILRKYTGCILPVTKSQYTKVPSILLLLNKTNQQKLGKEGYILRITSGAITIRANEPNGIFYGIQTLLQLLPSSSVENNRAIKNVFLIPSIEVVDNPRFEWRGVMLDVSRHFFPKSYIKSLIDNIAKYKFNIFHWHLTDDQGWRIQINGLPQLTDVGAWRVPRTGARFGEYEKPLSGESATYGGYYTQDDIREIVKYATERYISIVPEIDVPAHSMALIASFPNLSCHQKPAYVNPGSPLTKDEENVLCVANDSTYLILNTIFSQVAALFPGKYIHLGGDEAFKGFWVKDAKDQKLMVAEHLKNTEELQSYFIKKVVKIINDKGKKVIGWEEIMQGGLTPGTVIQSWTSIDAGIKAAKMRHKVIMSPWNHGLYMDNSLIENSYTFEPVPDNVDEKFILGGEGCLWTEDVPDEIQAEKMYWPRLMALSEVFWSLKDKKDWNNFKIKINTLFPQFDRDFK